MASERPSYPPPIDAKLRAAAKHIAHDMRRLAQSFEHRSDVFAWTAWYVFCRSLMDFFDPVSPKPDDILAEHYFHEPGTWRRVVESSSPPLDYTDFRAAANKLAAHLTYARVRYEGDDRWSPSREVTNHLLDLAMQFREALPEERNGWFDESSFGPPVSPDMMDDGEYTERESRTELHTVVSDEGLRDPDALAERIADEILQRIPALDTLRDLKDATDGVVNDARGISFQLDELVPIEEIERAYVLYALERFGGNKTRAAELLGFDPSTLYRKLNRWGLE